MDKFGDGAQVVIAGASGLVGQQLTKLLLDEQAVSQVHALVRSPLSLEHPKLNQIQDGQLRITQWDDKQTAPDFGFICLGTTKKQAGGKQGLAHVDYELVCQVAQTMKLVGVKRIAVVSSYGADARSLSHYLRCKGKMEQKLLTMSFERTVFVRPGPLAGERYPARTDEVFIGAILKVLSPLLIGPIANFKPIQAKDVARAMLYSVFKPFHSPGDNYITLTSREMHQLLDSYHISS